MSNSIYSIRFFLEVAGRGVSGHNVQIDQVLPFIPTPGMQVIAVKGDDYRLVEQVFWTGTYGSNGLPKFECFLGFEDKPEFRRLLKLGWKDAD